MFCVWLLFLFAFLHVCSILVMVAFASSFYPGILLPLPETLVVIVAEIMKSFTIDCTVITGSACWNTSRMRHIWANEAKYSHHSHHASTLASVGLDWIFEMLWNLSSLKCENPATCVAIKEEVKPEGPDWFCFQAILFCLQEPGFKNCWDLLQSTAASPHRERYQEEYRMWLMGDSLVGIEPPCKFFNIIIC